MEIADDDLDLDWGNLPPDYEQENRDFFDSGLPREVRLNPNEHDMVVRKSWADYAKEINLMRAQLRYMKKSVCYQGGQSVYENQRDNIDCEKEIKRLCKLRDAAKAMEKAAGYKMGEKNG